MGKSTAAQILAGRYDSLFDIPSEYQESIASESYVLKDDEKTEIVVPPGQRHRRDTWNDVLAAVGAGGYHGIIVVGAHGYHTLGEISYKHHEFVFGSLIINNFTTSRGQQLATTASGYDEKLKVRSLQRLWETLYALKSWEESQ